MKILSTLILSIIQLLAGIFDNTVAPIFTEEHAIANESFDRIVAAVNAQDSTALIELFSIKAQSDAASLDENAILFFDYINGEVVSFSRAEESGVSTDSYTDNGKVRKEIHSFFCVNTEKKEFFLAVKECIQDDFDKSNVGITSLYIIDAEDWPHNFEYGGDGLWTPGINIGKGFAPWAAYENGYSELP